MNFPEVFRKAGLVSLAVLAVQTPGAFAANVAPDAATPASEHQSVIARAVVRLSLKYHYPAVRLDRNLARRVLSRYIDTLDPGHFYFTQKDIQSFHAAFDDHLAKDLRTGNLEPAFAIQRFYQQQKKQLFSLALQLLSRKLDLNSPAHYRIERKDAPRPLDNAALEQLWQKRIDNEVLNRILRGESLGNARAVLISHYKDPGSEGDATSVFRQYMNAFMTALDPHSRYIPTLHAGQVLDGADLDQTVAGARLINRNGYLTAVRAPHPGHAQDNGGLANGDQILAIQMKPGGKAVPLSGWNLNQAVRTIRQSAGSGARLLVQLPGPPGLRRTRWVSLPPHATQSRPPRASAYIDFAREGTSQYKIGVIQVPDFYPSSNSGTTGSHSKGVATDVTYLVRLLKSKGVSALLLDMRGNPGGSFKEALTMTGLFMPADKPVVKIETRFGINRHSSIRKTGGIIWRGPLGILVNRASASATELFCGALQDYGRAIIMGTRTWGKGTIQTSIPLARHTHIDAPGKLLLTTAEFFRPDGNSPQIRGVTPDITLASASDVFIGGESAYPNALPRDATTPLHYKPLNDGDNKLIPKLKSYFQKQLAGTEALKLYKREIGLLRTTDDVETSLDLRKRKHQIASEDSSWEKLENDWLSVQGSMPGGNVDQPRSKAFRIPDLPLHLAIRIMGEFVNLSPSIGLKINFHIEGDNTYRCGYLRWGQALACTHESQQIFYSPDTHSSSKARAAAPPPPKGGKL